MEGSTGPYVTLAAMYGFQGKAVSKLEMDLFAVPYPRAIAMIVKHSPSLPRIIAFRSV